MKWVTVKKCSELYGLTEDAIRALKKKGEWRRDIHWKKAPNGRIFLNIERIDAWIEGRLA